MTMMWTNHRNAHLSGQSTVSQHRTGKLSDRQFDLLGLVRNWLDEIKISNPEVAKFIYKLIPAQCPFARDIKLFDRTILHIPPLCKLNPLYDQLVGLRFRALCYLVDECGVDILSEKWVENPVLLGRLSNLGRILRILTSKPIFVGLSLP